MGRQYMGTSRSAVSDADAALLDSQGVRLESYVDLAVRSCGQGWTAGMGLTIRPGSFDAAEGYHRSRSIDQDSLLGRAARANRLLPEPQGRTCEDQSAPDDISYKSARLGTS